MVGKSTEIFLENFHRYGLTKTEIEIVQMLFEGMDKKAIANSLFISE
jgi:DNA-binding NarL/FixJ family response regulator